MPFEPGSRIHSESRHVYEVGACRSEHPWGSIYDARKVFFNYRYDDRELYEAAEDEWLGVQIRTLGTRESSESAEREQYEPLLEYEATEALAQHSGWFPEPLDFFKATLDDADPGSGPYVLVMSKPHGLLLGAWSTRYAELLPWKLTICLEMLNLLDSLHRSGQLLGGFGPDDFLVDENGRLFCLASDRVLPDERIDEFRSCFPPERFDERFAAPEILRADEAYDRRADLYNWAALTVFLLTGQEINRPDAGSSPDQPTGEPLSAMAGALETIAAQAPEALRSLSPKLAKLPTENLVEEWMKGLRRLLAANADERPGSVGEFREQLASRPKKKRSKSMWKQLLGG